MKKTVIFFMFLMVLIEIRSEIKLLGNEVYLSLHKSKIKKEYLEKYKIVNIYEDSIRGFINYNNNLYYDVVSENCEKGKRFNLAVYNSIDSSLDLISEICFDEIRAIFIFKDNLYLFVCENELKKNQYYTIFNIKKANPLVVSSFYTLKDQNYTAIETIPETISNNITIDSNWQLKLLVKSFKKKINTFNLLFSWMPRGIGPIWEIDKNSKKLTWYIFDDDLNLLYTEEYKE